MDCNLLRSGVTAELLCKKSDPRAAIAELVAALLSRRMAGRSLALEVTRIIRPISGACAPKDRRCTSAPVRPAARSTRSFAPVATLLCARAAAGIRRSTSPPGASPRSSGAMDRMLWLSMFRASCSPRTTTSSTSSPRAWSEATTSTPIRGCACPRRWRVTRLRSARMRRRRVTRTSTTHTACSSQGRTRPSPIRFSTGASRRHGRRIRD